MVNETTVRMSVVNCGDINKYRVYATWFILKYIILIHTITREDKKQTVFDIF